MLRLMHEQATNALISQGVIAGGMTAKVNAALHAAKQLRRSIAVASWQSPEQITQLLKGQGIGTQIQANDFTYTASIKSFKERIERKYLCQQRPH